MSTNGINREQFNLWKHDPVTKLLLSFLIDKRKFMVDRVSEMWVDGTEIPPAVRGQIIELGEMAGIEFETIEAFYKPEEENVAIAESVEG